MGHHIVLFFSLIIGFFTLGASSVTFGQCPTDTLFWVDFQNQQIPPSWGNLDQDSLTDQNNRPENWYIAPHSTSGTSAAPNYVAISNSWFSPAGQADNWLIADAIVVCDTNLFLVWKSAPFEGPVYMDGYEVLLSTAAGSIDSFTVNLQTFAEGIGATGQSTPGTVHTAYTGNRGLLQNWRASLEAWFGDTIYIAFRHTSTDDNFLLLDDIGVIRVPRQDAAVSAISYNTAYPVVPLSQTRAMTFSATVTNPGIDSLAQVNVDFAGTRNGQPVFTALDTVLMLPPLGSEVLTTANVFTPAQTGTYVVTATSSPADDNGNNDSQSLTFVVDDSVYARDEGPVAGIRSIGSNGGFIGQTFRLFVADTLTSLSFYVDGTTGMDTLFGAVYAYGATPGALLAQTDPWAVPANFTGWVTLGIAGIDLPLMAGTYLFGLEESASGALNLGWTTSKSEAGTAWHRVGTTWATTTSLNLSGTYMVRTNFGVVDELVAAPLAFAGQALQLFPNPSDGQFQLRFAQPLARRSRLEVRDLAGRVILSQYLPGGTSTLELNLAEAANGLYLLVLDGQALGRMVLEK